MPTVVVLWKPNARGELLPKAGADFFPDKSLPTREAGFYQEYRSETAAPRQTAYHSIVSPTARI
jgi:hypothetical protein